MAVVIDTPGGNQGDDLGVTGVTAAKERQRPYSWTCLNCGAQNVGFMEDGCESCPVGHGMTAPGPLPPVDFNCKACSGKGKVERKCGTCNGTGTVGAGDVAGVPQACLTCGGAGSLGMDCARCEGSGLDPEPTAKQTVVKETPMAGEVLQEQIDNAEAGRQALAALAEMEQKLHKPKLPTLENADQPVAHVRRYLVVEISGPSSDVIDALVAVDQQPQTFNVGMNKAISRRVVEIAASPTTDRLFPKL